MSRAGIGLPAAALPALATAAALVALPIAFPLEAYPWSRALWRALVALAALVAAAWPPRHPARVRTVALLCAPLVLASILAAACRARAVDEAALLAAPFLAGLLGMSLARFEPARRALALLLVGLGCAAAIHAVLQHHRTYAQQAALLRAGTLSIPGPGADRPEAVLRRLEEGRPAGPFALPAALGGFLALALPLTAAAAARARRPWLRAAALSAALLQAYALVLTRSFGGIGAATVGLLIVLPLLVSRRRRLAAGAVVLVSLLLAGAALRARLTEVASGTGGDPLSLRLGNWGAAARMAVEHPLLGVGPGSFGAYYPRYMRAGMNETRFAHNSYLQLAGGWGAWALWPVGVLLLGWARAARRDRAGPGARLPVIAGAGTFLVHNLVDFTLYLPAIALPGGLLAGLSLGTTEAKAPAARPIAARAMPRLIAGLVLAALLGTHALRSFEQEVGLAEALALARAGDVAGAVVAGLRAAERRPSNPDAWAFVAQAVLARGMDDPGLRAAGERAAQRAVSLEPESAVLHFTRALYHRAAGEHAPAYREMRRAHRLFPLKPLYAPPRGAEDSGRTEP